MPEIKVVRTHAGQREEQTTTTGTKAWELFRDDADVIAARVGGELKDLAYELRDGDEVEGVDISSTDGRDILRHSTAHVMAQAVQQLWPEAKLGIGPPVADGFYYDFDVETPFVPEDLVKIESAMRKIIKENQRFERRVTTDAEAINELQDEPYKLELIGLKGGAGADDTEGASVEVASGAGAELTIYDNLGRNGEAKWSDLCRGPHLPTTRRIPAFKLMRSAAAYWRGDEKNKQLQRIYGTAWESKEALEAHLHRIEEAERRDHRKLGRELDLFSFPDEIGSGLAVFHPKGGVLKRVMEDYVRQRHIEEGFDYVGTPHITKEGLFHTSGHLPYFADTMFPPMEMEGANYYLKAMNCPMHNLIFRSRGRSYRELPLRLFEFGTVYRFEKSGVIHGLTRVRGLTQDDSHSYCTPEQAPEEVKHLLGFVLGLLRDFGLDDFYLELSTRDAAKDKFMGSDEQWEVATKVLEDAATETGLELVPDPGGAAFYGPKISVQARDAIGRTWQMSTIQYDFNQPAGFELAYQAADGSRQQPVMIHSAKFGSLERFYGVLVEHYAGAFPPWLAPVQVQAIPVADAFSDYLHDVARQMKAQGIRVEVDDSDDRMQKKIRNAQLQKVPFMMIAGNDDVEAGAVSFRYRDGRQDNGVPLEEAIQRVQQAVATREQV
ncbi:MAG: Threonyl-tRNA synthetase [uncultured Nocardioides sp.]|uniref:Threonine--tRNA ligase n=1 Tax=uncultured Nocardioides sp. TaxID=198441 RepID=A0A6J4MYE9_9ACTN|nr:MAG: Threonyl-tRNA synthetase [uncultured Nocardioides sp.]